jgi:hypothetical protein
VRITLLVAAIITLILAVSRLQLGLAEYGVDTLIIDNNYKILVKNGIARDDPSAGAILRSGLEHRHGGRSVRDTIFLLMTATIEFAGVVALHRAKTRITAVHVPSDTGRPIANE